jgi:16S rRNA (guanine(966)-N(2))-methyltransferase RsmD
MTRIIAGRNKGRRLKTPQGLETRPTSGRVKQTLFDILAPVVPGCRFLDPFAGSGGIGLEAASRGAARVVLVDSSPAAIAAIRENLRALSGSIGEVEVFRQDAQLALVAFAERGQRFDVVYLDPPYASELYEPLVERAGSLLTDDGWIVVEHFKKRVLPERIGMLALGRSVRIGDHRLSFYRRREKATP